MFLLFGWGHRSVKDFGSANLQSCSVCNNNVESRKLKITTWFTLFFIPVIPYKTEYVVACPICKNYISISREVFENEIKHTPEENKYAGKTETQIAYLKQMEELQVVKNINE